MYGYALSRTPSQRTTSRHQMFDRQTKSPSYRDRFVGDRKSPGRTPPRAENHMQDMEFSSVKPSCCTPSTPRTMKRPHVIADRILDAPDVCIDFPSKLVDVSENRVVAVGLGQSVYIWRSGEVHELMSSESVINSVCWVGNQLALSGDGHTELWDVDRHTPVTLYKDHDGRSAAMASFDNKLATGGADGAIHVYDRRGCLTTSFKAHGSEICALAWSLDGGSIASSGLDCMVNVWGGRQRQRFRHDDIVSGLAWMNSGVLVVGESGAQGRISTVHTRSDDGGREVMSGKPVTGLQWSPEWGILASHDDQEGTWSMWAHDLSRNVGEFHGHSQGILGMSASSDGDLVVTISSDETLRVWELGHATTTQSPARGRQGTPRMCGTPGGSGPALR